MALEVATYIDDLVTTNPVAGDPVSQADDHLRLIKSVLQNQFPDAGDGGIYGLRSATVQATTSGTSIDFTSIPSWVKRITIMFVGVSTNGTSPLMVQIGDAGGVEATGYAGSASQFSTVLSSTQFATGFGVTSTLNTSSVINGSLTLTLQNAATNTWAASGSIGFSDQASAAASGGAKSLSAILDRVRITTVSGTSTFDAGSVNIQYD